MLEISKKFWAVALCALLSLSAFAQNNNPSNNGNTPYSRYGYGRMAESSFMRNRAMGGIGQGLRSNQQTNTMNPASYTAIDSLTFLFDFGVNATYNNYKENGASQHDWNGGLEYIAMQFPMGKYFSASLGLLPYSYVGYNYGSADSIKLNPDNEDLAETAYFTNLFQGTGGLNKVYLGFAGKPAKWVSLGVNVGYIFGEITHDFNQTFLNEDFKPNPSLDPAFSSQQISTRALELQFGAQFMHTFNEKHDVTIGGTFTPKMKMWTDTRSVSGLGELSNPTQGDTITASHNLAIPQSIAAGFTYVYDKRLTVGFDFEQTNWADVTGLNERLQVEDNLYKNARRYALGAEYVPSLTSRKYFESMRYRIGMNYSNSYVQVNGSDNRELGFTFGLGFPLKNQKSMVNVAFEYVDIKPENKNFLSENYFQINVGLTFNEFWFFKNKLK